MKKFLIILYVLTIAILPILAINGETQAYYKDDCFALQYEMEVEIEQPTSGGQYSTKITTSKGTKIYSTKKICANGDDKVSIKGSPLQTMSTLNYPKFEVSDGGKTVKVTYCSKGPTGTYVPGKTSCINAKGGSEKSETFDRTKYNSFEDFANAVQSSASKNIGDSEGVKLLGLKTNDAKDNLKTETSSVGEKYATGQARCKGNAAAKSLGWILCPILDFMGDASDKVYNDFVEPRLQVPPRLFNETDSTRVAWETFRNFANIIFVILLLFVIFSQISGVGIDNYGIKKILPKLIVAAILINLSYILCILAVDISNILGNAFQGLFNEIGKGLETSIPSEITIDSGGAGSDNFDISEITTTAVSGVALLGVLVAGGAAIFANPAILLSLLVSALGIVVSIFFLFILLTARQAAIVVLVVVSPIAVILYALPNTKSIFNKWLKFFEGLLLVYPIAGLLVGAGNYVSKLLIAAGFGDGFVSALTAMIVSVVPIFFIPVVLKQSFAALGNIGSKIAGIGQRLGGAAQGSARNSGFYNNLQRAGLERQTRLRAGLNKDGTRGSRALGTLLSGGARNRQRNTVAYRRMMEETGSLEATEGEHYFDSTLDKMAKDQLVASGVANNIGINEKDGKVEIETGGLTDALVNALRQGNDAQARAITDMLSSKGEDGRLAVKTAWNTAAQGGGVSNQTASAFANTIMSNHALDYKNNDRAMFDVARTISSNPEGNAGLTTTDYVSNNQSNLANKVTAGNIGTMDDNAFNDVFGGYNGRPVAVPDGADMNAIGATAYAALNDQNANIKVERRAALESIVAQSGYSPTNVQNVRVVDGGSSMNISH